MNEYIAESRKKCKQRYALLLCIAEILWLKCKIHKHWNVEKATKPGFITFEGQT